MKLLPLYLCVFAIFLAGCEEGGSANVSGKVTAGGEKVGVGNLTFAPVGGGLQPAVVAVKEDGTYILNGAAVGKNKVVFAASDGAAPVTLELGTMPTLPKYTGYTVKASEVTLKGGANTVDIELEAPPTK